MDESIGKVERRGRELSNELGIALFAAFDILWFRKHHKWSKELEESFISYIKDYKVGKNIFTFLKEVS